MHSENTFEENNYEDLFYDRLTQLRSAKKVSARHEPFHRPESRLYQRTGK